MLRQALENTSPLDDFVQVITDLTQYELRYSMKSDVFHARFEAGELGDALDLIRWANKYEIYQEIKAEIAQTHRDRPASSMRACVFMTTPSYRLWRS